MRFFLFQNRRNFFFYHEIYILKSNTNTLSYVIKIVIRIVGLLSRNNERYTPKKSTAYIGKVFKKHYIPKGIQSIFESSSIDQLLKSIVETLGPIIFLHQCVMDGFYMF